MNIRPRTLRAANNLLYGSSVLLVIAAVLYCAICKDMPAWQLWGGVALSIGATIWGLYYVTLHYRISPEGVTYGYFLRRKRHLNWTDIERTELSEGDSQGVANCHITLHPKEGTPLRLSSDILSLDDVQELADELRSAGLLQTKNT